MSSSIQYDSKFVLNKFYPQNLFLLTYYPSSNMVPNSLLYHLRKTNPTIEIDGSSKLIDQVEDVKYIFVNIFDLTLIGFKIWELLNFFDGRYILYLFIVKLWNGYDNG